MKFFQHARLAQLLLMALPASTLACSVEAEPEYGTGASAFEVPDDEDVKWAVENGWESFAFMDECVSIGADGKKVTEAPLPVGNGAHVECIRNTGVKQDTMSVQSQTG